MQKPDVPHLLRKADWWPSMWGKNSECYRRSADCCEHTAEAPKIVWGFRGGFLERATLKLGPGAWTQMLVSVSLRRRLFQAKCIQFPPHFHISPSPSACSSSLLTFVVPQLSFLFRSLSCSHLSSRKEFQYLHILDCWVTHFSIPCNLGLLSPLHWNY